MKCLSCKSGNMEESTTTYTAVLKNCILIIKNVPCMKCEQCGEVLYNTDILEKIDDKIGSFICKFHHPFYITNPEQR